MHDILVEEEVLAENERFARENRSHFVEKGIFVLNLVSSPGAGKTSLVERTLEALRERVRMAVIEGDLATDNDSRRIGRLGIPVRQITTGRACHLDAHMIHHCLDWIDEVAPRLLIIENVGNLVCPSDFYLGEDVVVTIISTTEGDDKPLKYPFIFRKSKALVINKIDLLPYTDFSVEAVKGNALVVNPHLTFFELSCRTGEGLERWIDWVKEVAGL